MAAGIPKDVQEAFYRVVHDRDVPKLAAQMGMAASTLYGKSNTSESSTFKPTLADAIILTNITGDKRIAQAFAHSVGGVFFELPDLSNISTDALMLHLTRIQIFNGKLHEEVHEALSNDNRISAKEYALIEHAAHEEIAKILEALARMREMAGL